jgi:predicted ester cyclase
MNIPPSRHTDSGKESPAGLSPSQMRDLMRHWYEDVLSGTIADPSRPASGDWDKTDINLAHLFTPDYVSHFVPPPPGGWKRGIQAALQIIQIYRLACPDLTIKIEDIMVSGDKVITRYTAEGTHTASPFLNMPATARHYKVPVIGIDRIENGKIAESWGQWDVYSLMQQMGILPAAMQPRV